MENLILGLDCGGTHTDAALLLVDEVLGSARILASAKTETIHDNLPLSIGNVLTALMGRDGISDWLSQIERITLGSTLAVNALVRDRADEVGLALSAGPGLAADHFILGSHVCMVKGGLDHRGMEVQPLQLEELRRKAVEWQAEGVRAVACVSKFSPRNPRHELEMAEAVKSVCQLPVCMGHTLSGRLNFPRRIATAYYNAAVMRLQNDFLKAVESTLDKMGIRIAPRLLKADGGAIPFALASKEPVHSILSGPAASVMGMLALGLPDEECVLLVDMGGTTTDLALVYKNSPVIDRDGMRIRDRHTLVNSLASISIGIGGDSLLYWMRGEDGERILQVGPDRIGPAMAFGGNRPTLLDALNVADGVTDTDERGNGAASHAGMMAFAAEAGLSQEQVKEVAVSAVRYAMEKVAKAVADLVRNINSKPVYTLAGLRNISEAEPSCAVIAGGPAKCVQERLRAVLGLPVNLAPHFDIANAIGAGLTLPTASLEIYVDGAKKLLSAPAIGFSEKIPASFTPDDAERKARDLLEEHIADYGQSHVRVDVVETEVFAVLDDAGRGSRDIRVMVQARPGICAKVQL